ncbi:VOC family protein [Maribacter algarum]|nr:VOC family protein [Maribacter algarum]
MKPLLHNTWLKIIILICAVTSISFSSTSSNKIEPIHLDDIHFIVTDEEEAVAFFTKHFGGREMAHPGERFDLVRFISLKWQGPTITITPIGPYADLPPERNQRWLDAEIIVPKSEKTKPVYGAKWLAISTSSLDKSRSELLAAGVEISENDVSLPLEPKTPAFSIYGPDGFEIIIVERPEYDFGDAKYAIDHIQFLVKDVHATQEQVEKVFAAKQLESQPETVGLMVADAKLILSEPKALGINPKDVSSRLAKGTIRTGLDHLGFLYEDVKSAANEAEKNGYSPIFQPQKYIYKGKPTVYTFSAFKLPEDFNIEMVQADGRVGPHSYYMDQCNLKEKP